MRSSLRALLAAILLLGGPQAPLLAAKPGGPASRIEGKVLGADGKPLAGARVLAYHLGSERLFSSEVVGSNAKYAIGHLPHGYLDLAVETPSGVYAGSEVLQLGPSSKASVSFRVRPDPEGARTDGHRHPGSERDIVGVAALTESPRGAEFWRSPRGVAILAGAGALVLLALAGGGDEPEQTAPVAP